MLPTHQPHTGAVDLSSIDDIHTRKAIEAQISNFGQTPPQLFRKRHPQRQPPARTPLRVLLAAPSTLRPAVCMFAPTTGGRLPAAVVRLEVAENRVVAVAADRCGAALRCAAA